VLALYRPGPLGSGMVDDFILRKKGKQKIDYFIDDLKACLEPTYGVIVYQEQVMQIAQIIGGYTLGAADLLRRAMGKKKAEEMAKHRDLMREGAQEGLRRKAGDAALRPDGEVRRVRLQQVAYRRLRGHHLPHRLAEGAPLRGLHGGDAVVGHGRHRHGEDLPRRCDQQRPADPRPGRQCLANTASYPVDRSTVRYGLGAIKGTGEQAVNTILKAVRRRARSGISSISAGASTSGWSTGGRSKR
jgi:DNA polymerase-3 subunit alpha